MNQNVRTVLCVAAVFATIAISVSTMLETLWMTFGWPEDATLAVGYWARPFMFCSIAIAFAICVRGWLIGEDLKPALVFGGMIVVGSSAQRYGIWLSLSVSLAGVAYYIALALRLVLRDLATLGVGSNSMPQEGGKKKAEQARRANAC